MLIGADIAFVVSWILVKILHATRGMRLIE